MSDRASLNDPAQVFYDRLSRSYDLLANASEHTAREAGLDLLAVEAGERVLEIGFGTGHGLVDLARAATPAGRVVGVDYSLGMHRVARERLVDAGIGDPTRQVLGDGRTLPLRSDGFDAVFLSFTLELFGTAIPGVLTEIHRVLRPTGRRRGRLDGRQSRRRRQRLDDRPLQVAPPSLPALHRLRADRYRSAARSSGFPDR